jgi:hypothetical protein
VVVVVGGLVSLNRLQGFGPFDRFDRIGLFDRLYRLLLLSRLHWVRRLRTLRVVGSVSAVDAFLQIDQSGDEVRVRLTACGGPPHVGRLAD